tara:strand:- start:1427 stop:2197 length:771 start_codon:yes stop_codon:yes gene_type:complete
MSGIVGKNSGRGSGVVGATPVADESVDSDAYVNASIDNAHLADDAAGTDEIADNAVTLAKMAGGTDGQIITYDASGDPVAVGPGSDGQVLTSTGAGSPPAFEAAGGGKVLQIYTLINTTTYSTSTVFSNGTTLPTITDGTSLFDAAAFTPTSGSSKILVEVCMATSGTSDGHATVWMCKDSISNAVAVSACHSQTSYIQLLKLTYEESASDTSARTFKLRYANNYSGRTTTINKNHEGNNTWGGINSTIQITEYAT